MDTDERHNVRSCVFGEGMFGVGIGFLSSVSVLPLLLKRLGASEIEIGLVGSIFWAGWVLLQPLGLLLFGRRRRTKRFLIPWSACCSVPTYLAMGAVVYFLAPASPRLCSILLLVLLAVRVLGAGMAIPFWLDWQAMMFRRAIRGRVIGMMASAGPLGATIAALAAAKVVGSLGFPQNYSLLFPVAIVSFVTALASFASVREPESLTAPHEGLKRGDVLRRFRHSLGEKNFRNYLIGRILMSLGAGAAAFYAVHFSSAESGGLTEGTVIGLSALLGVTQFLAGYPLGRLGDRAGHKVGVVLGAVAQVAAILVAYVGEGALACGLSFALVGIAWSASWVSHVNMLFETCPHDSRVAHITLSNIVLGPVLWLVPVATGWMIGHVGMRTGIGLTLIPTLLGIAWLALVVREPRDIALGRQNRDAAEAA